MKISRGGKIITCCAVAAMVYGAASAQAENVHLGKEVPSTEQVIELLMPADGNLKVRGLRLKNEAPVDEYAGEGIDDTVSADAGGGESRSISMEVYFEFDSATLSDAAIAQLAPVGRALESQELEVLSFELEGHTDAVGSEGYNLSLSERRAKAVRNFFVQEYGIEGDRLTPVGRGEAVLLDPANPAAGENRRVTIVAR